MELHRLDGIDATGLDNIDVSGIRDSSNYINGVDDTPEIAYEILDEEGNVVMYADLDENIYVIDGLSGFFKKIGRGLKKFGKKVIKPIVKTFNRFLNPATILLRNGFLLAMKVNMMKVASKLRFGYLSEAEVRKRGGDLRKFAKMRKAVQKAEKIYELAGGKSKNLKKAILKGKGNKDRKVPLSGFALGNPFDMEETGVYNDPFEKFVIESDPDMVEAFLNNEMQVDGLGAVVSSTAIAAASSAVAGVAALVGKIGNIFGKAKEIKGQAQTLFAKPKQQTPLPLIPPFGAPRNQFPVQNFSPPNLPATTQNNKKVAENDENGGSDKESFFKKHKTPILIGAGVLVVGTGIALAMKATKKESKPVDGLPKKRRTTKQKTKPPRRDSLGRFTSKRSSTSKNKRPTKLVPKALL